MKSIKRSIQLFSFAFMLAFAGIHFSADDAQACVDYYTTDWGGIGTDCEGPGDECLVCIGDPIVD